MRSVKEERRSVVEQEKKGVMDWLIYVFPILGMIVIFVIALAKFDAFVALNNETIEQCKNMLESQNKTIQMKEDNLQEIVKEIGGLYQQNRQLEDKIADLLEPTMAIAENGKQGYSIREIYQTKEEAKKNIFFIEEESDVTFAIEAEEVKIRKVEISSGSEELIVPDLQNTDSAVGFSQHIAREEYLITITYSYQNTVKKRFFVIQARK